MDTKKVREAVEIIRQAKQELAEMAHEYLKRVDNTFGCAEECESAERDYENNISLLGCYGIGGRIFLGNELWRFGDNFSISFKENDIEIQLSFRFDNEWDTYIYSITCEESSIYQYVPPFNHDYGFTLTIVYCDSKYKKNFKVVVLRQ